VTTRWLIVDELAVRAPATTGAVVTFGDSITDGLYSGVNADARYPDHLARRLANAGIPLSPVNAGISGNVLTQSNPPWSPSGPSGLERLDSDVVGQPGVTTAIVLEGINRIRSTGPDAVIDGLRHVVHRLHAAGIKVVLGTLPPAKAEVDRDRRKVNRWIRSASGTPVADFDRALADPSDPHRTSGRYDSGDGVHPNSAGYATLARAVPLRALALPRCE
jgi:lysophospholipase L1-like esterase